MRWRRPRPVDGAATRTALNIESIRLISWAQSDAEKLISEGRMDGAVVLGRMVQVLLDASSLRLWSYCCGGRRGGPRRRMQAVGLQRYRKLHHNAISSAMTW